MMMMTKYGPFVMYMWPMIVCSLDLQPLTSTSAIHLAIDVNIFAPTFRWHFQLHTKITLTFQENEKKVG